MAIRKRTALLIDWAGCPAPLLREIDRFNARARGRRMRDLALLGLLAEQAGLRLGADQESLTGWPVLVPATATVSTAPPAKVPGQTAEHAQGLDRAMGAFGF